MFKNLTLIFIVLLLFFFSFHTVHAEVIINEVMYAPEGVQSGREWLEIKNVSGSSIDFSEKIGSAFRYRFIKVNSDSDSPISPFDSDKFMLQSGELAVIVSDGNKFLIDYPDFSGLLLKSSFGSLNDQGDIIVIYDKSSTQDIDSVTYSPEQNGNKDGNSLQLVDSSWITTTPTPGQANQSSSSPSNNDIESSNTTTNENSATTAEEKPKITTSPTIKTKITAKNISFSGLPLTFQASATGYEGEKLFYGKFFVNFGDGDSKEIPASSGDNFSHTYLYPGDYIVILEYYSSGNIPEASHQIVVKAVKPDIIISAVGDASDFFVELTNNTDYEADISSWILSNAAASFTFPRNTVIGSKRKMTISSSLTHFSFSDKNTLKLMTPQWKIIHDFFAVVTSSQKETVKPIIKVNQDGEREDGGVPIEDTETVMPLENLSGATLLSDATEESSSGSYFFSISALMFIGASAGAVYFIRRKKNVVPGSDFKILEQ